ncbi:MAG TPA: L-threonylcarbamoyladenylate synthase [Burkholderiaceae bacterium]|nr:L-threonylcarbamoyladenylate synthase [Burkholderiaceae bacterium]
MSDASAGGPNMVDAATVRRAVEVLLRGGLVAFPTETVYGLGADADQPRAVAAIFQAKGRPKAHPLIVHVAQAGAVQRWARQIPTPAHELMRRFWPGPLTLVLPRSARATDLLTGGQDTVALRCPANVWAQSLIRGLSAARGDESAAIAAPSANRYGRISPTSAAHVRADLGEKPDGLVDYIIDGGATELGIESTIVDFAGEGTRILRPGSIDRAQIAAAIGEEVQVAAETVTTPRVSGRVSGHYAPSKPLELVEPRNLAARVKSLQPLALGVLAPQELLVQLNAADLAMTIAAALAPQEYAHWLYEHLRALDASAAQRLLIAVPPSGEAWEAVHDRLRRAAAGSDGRIIDAD